MTTAPCATALCATAVRVGAGLFPTGTVVDFDNSYGSWRMEAIADPNGDYSLELRLGGIVMQTW